MMRRWWWVAILGLVVLPPMDLRGQDGAATPEPGAAASEAATQDFDSLYAKWNQLQADAKAKAAAFGAAAAGEKDALRAEYEALAAQLEELLPALRTAALDRYRAAETPDDATTRLLLGMMINDAARDRGDDALALGAELAAKRCPRDLFERAAKAPRLGLFAREIVDEALKRYDETIADDLPRLKIVTSKGDIVVELFENEAPNAVANFVSLAQKGFYDGLSFHRVLEGFMAQGGCPKGTGEGGPGYTIACECYEPNRRNHFTGSLAMAHAGRDTGGSQFYITFERTSTLDGRHTVFGRVIEGQDVLGKITRRDPQATPPLPEPDRIERIEILRLRDHAYEPVTKPDPTSPAPSTENSDAGKTEESGGGQ